MRNIVYAAQPAAWHQAAAASGMLLSEEFKPSDAVELVTSHLCVQSRRGLRALSCRLTPWSC